jgi:structural maintenance of chromosome 3 (chondroitin sulfate proteoglycan 6)
MEEVSQSISNGSTNLDKEKQLLDTNRRKLEKQEMSMDKYATKKALLLKQKDEATSKIRDLGVLPEEAFQSHYTEEESSHVSRPAILLSSCVTVGGSSCSAS